MTGTEWIVDAYGCSPDRLRDLSTLQALFARLMRDLDLHACGDGRWHQFPDSGGITGMTVLTESHLACHSFPEYGTLCLNLFCCRPRPEWDFAAAAAVDRRGADGQRPPPRSAVRGSARVRGVALGV